MTNFRKAVKNLVDSDLPDSAVKDLLREMLCKSKDSDCDNVNRFFANKPYVVADLPNTRPTWIS